MSELQTGALSIQKGKIVTTNRVGKGTKADKFELVYKRTDGKGSDKESKASKFTVDFTDEEKSIIKDAVAGKDGGEVCIVKELNKVGENDYWNLKTVKSVSAYVAPKNTYKTNKTSNSSGTKSTFDTAGVKVGAVLHDAALIATTQKGAKVTTEDVVSVAKELLISSMKLEEEVRNGSFSSSTTTTTNSSTTTETKAEYKEVESSSDLDSFDDLENFNIDL